MTSTVTNIVKAAALAGPALAIGAMSIYVADAVPLFPQPQDVPSAIDAAAPRQYEAPLRAPGTSHAPSSWSRTCPACRWRSAPARPPQPWRRRAARSSGRKDSAGGTLTRGRPLRRVPGSTSVRQPPPSLPPPLHGSGWPTPAPTLRRSGVPSTSANRKKTSRSSPSSATSSSGRSVWPPRSHCLVIARRSTSRDPLTTPPGGDDD